MLIGLRVDLGRKPISAQLASCYLLWRSEKPSDLSTDEMSTNVRAVRESWSDDFQIREERYVSDALVAKGLRPPQVGAIHAVKAGRHL